MKVREVFEKLNGDYNITKMSKEVQIGERKLRNTLKELGMTFDNSLKKWSFNGDENILEREITEFATTSTPRNKKTTEKNAEVQKSTNIFTEDEIDTLKQLIKERKRDYQLFSEYRIYDEISKVPTDEETERTAYNFSKSTLTRFKSYAKERRLPLQDLAELAIIELLEKYDKR